jgi:hypothetical protein
VLAERRVRRGAAHRARPRPARRRCALAPSCRAGNRLRQR